MDLLQLRYFYDSANYMSISKTAEKYNVPPTSVSASIRRLEEELGCRLFDRTPNRILLNEKGRLMRESLKRIFDEMDAMLRAVSRGVDDAKEIKILVKAIRTLMTEQMIQYKSRYAHTRFKLVADFDETDPTDYDLVVDTEGDRYAGYEAVPLGRQRICIYAAADSGLCGRKLCLTDLAKEPFVVMSQRGTHGRIFAAACEQAGFSPSIVAQVNDSACFRKIISSGVAIGVTGEFAGSVTNSSTLVPLDVTDFEQEQTICLYYKAEKLYGNTARFVSFLRENIHKESAGHGQFLI